MVAVINHQLRAVVDGIRAIQTDLADLKPYVSPAVHRAYDVILDEMRKWRELVTHQVSQLGFLLGTRTRKRRRRLALREVVKNVTMPLALYMIDYGVEFENQVPANLRTPPIFEAELHAVLLHILTNALKAVQARETRQIAVKAKREEDGVHIFMLDTGSGIEPDRREEVFKPFVTSSAPDPILGVGTGLGLKIVRDILANYDGTARFVDAEAPWHTCIEIFLPERG